MKTAIAKQISFTHPQWVLERAAYLIERSGRQYPNIGYEALYSASRDAESHFQPRKSARDLFYRAELWAACEAICNRFKLDFIDPTGRAQGWLWFAPVEKITHCFRAVARQLGENND